LNLPRLRILNLSTEIIPELTNMPLLSKISLKRIWKKDLVRLFVSISHADTIIIKTICNYDHSLEYSDSSDNENDIDIEEKDEITSKSFFNQLLSKAASSDSSITSYPRNIRTIEFKVTTFVCYGRFQQQFIPLLGQMKCIRKIILNTNFPSYHVIVNLFRQWSSSLSYVDLSKSNVTLTTEPEYFGHLMNSNTSNTSKGTKIDLSHLIVLKLCGWNQELIDSLCCPVLETFSNSKDYHPTEQEESQYDLEGYYLDEEKDSESDYDDNKDHIKYSNDNTSSSSNSRRTLISNTKTIYPILNITPFISRLKSIKSLSIYGPFVCLNASEMINNNKMNSLTELTLKAPFDHTIDISSLLQISPYLSRLSLTLLLSSLTIEILTLLNAYIPHTRLNILSLTGMSKSSDVRFEDDKITMIMNIINKCSKLSFLTPISLEYRDSTFALRKRIYDHPRVKNGMLQYRHLN
jgi:hypothetical protein